MARLHIKTVQLQADEDADLHVSITRTDDRGNGWINRYYTCYDWQMEKYGKHPGRLMRRGLALLAMAARRDLGVDILGGE